MYYIIDRTSALTLCRSSNRKYLEEILQEMPKASRQQYLIQYKSI